MQQGGIVQLVAALEDAGGEAGGLTVEDALGDGIAMDLNSIKGITGAGFDGATGGTDVGDQRGVVLGKGIGGHGYDAKLGFCYGVLGEAEVGVDVIAYYLVIIFL